MLKHEHKNLCGLTISKVDAINFLQSSDGLFLVILNVNMPEIACKWTECAVDPGNVY